MNYRRSLIFLFSILAVLVFNVESADACAGKAYQMTTLEKFEKSEFVIVAKAVSGERFKEGEEFYHPFPIKSLKMSVEKVFKGNLKVSDEIIILAGNGYDDFETFRESDIGRSHLIYLCLPKQSPNVFRISQGMSGWLADKNAIELKYQVNIAAEDLLYLEKMDKVRGKTRIYGTIDTNQITSYGEGEIKNFGGLTIEIRGDAGTYRVKTNENGVYEIYDLPEGTYWISPKIPKGWQIIDVSSFGYNGENNSASNSQVKLKTGRHAYYNFNLDATTTITGKVIAPTGKPLDGVCLDLVPFKSKDFDSYVNNDCTDEDGKFSIEQIAGGNYILVVNKDNEISSEQPFPTAFYPNVFERGKAKIIKIVEGENQSGIVVQIPQVREVITLSGILVSSDGVPVAYGRIRFDAQKTDASVSGDSWAITNGDGKFSLRILKGLEGKLSGRVVLNANQFKECPQIVKMMNEKGSPTWHQEISETIEIQADKNFDNVELKLSFPSCNKTTIKGEILID